MRTLIAAAILAAGLGVAATGVAFADTDNNSYSHNDSHNSDNSRHHTVTGCAGILTCFSILDL